MCINKIQTKFGTVEYKLVGKGTPILVLHGGHSNCKEQLVIKGFPLEKFQFIIPSRPGYGNTTLKGNESAKKTAKLLSQLLIHLSISKVVVYGISAGALTAIEFVNHYKNNIKCLLLVSAVSKKWMQKNSVLHKKAKLIFHPAIEKYTWIVVNQLLKKEFKYFVKKFHQSFSTVNQEHLNKTDIGTFISTMKQYRSGRGFINDIEQDFPIKSLQQIQCPTLIIHSKNDASVSIEHAIHAQNNIPNSRLHLLENTWGHMIWIGNESEELNQIIIDFIKNK